MQLLISVTLILVAMAGAAADDIDDLLREANNQLTFKIFSESAKANPNNSFAISAINLMPSLSLLAVASEGSTRDEIMRTLGFKNEEILRKANFRARSILKPDLELMTMANSIFISLNYELDENFNKSNWNSFRTEVQNIDFLNTGCAGYTIIEWVDRKIGGGDQINSVINKDTKALLVNVIDFKGNWKRPFWSNSTSFSSFAFTNEVYSQAYMMYRQDIFKYAENEEMDAKILEIPYAGSEASIVIILPNKVDEGLGALLQKVKDISILKEAFSKLQPVNVKVTIPQIHSSMDMGWHNDLTEVLKKIGVKKIFDSKTSDITKMAKERLHVTKIVQSVLPTIDEQETYKRDSNEDAYNEYEMAHSENKNKTFSAKHTFAFLIKVRGIVLLSGMYTGQRCYGMTYKDKADGECFDLDECCMYKDSERR